MSLLTAQHDSNGPPAAIFTTSTPGVQSPLQRGEEKEGAPWVILKARTQSSWVFTHNKWNGIRIYGKGKKIVEGYYGSLEMKNYTSLAIITYTWLWKEL